MIAIKFIVCVVGFQIANTILVFILFLELVLFVMTRALKQPPTKERKKQYGVRSLGVKPMEERVYAKQRNGEIVGREMQS